MGEDFLDIEYNIFHYKIKTIEATGNYISMHNSDSMQTSTSMHNIAGRDVFRNQVGRGEILDFCCPNQVKPRAEKKKNRGLLGKFSLFFPISYFKYGQKIGF